MTTSALQVLLVGTDGTERSEPAVTAGLELARRFRASVEIVHAVPVPSSLWPGLEPSRVAAVHAEAIAAAFEDLRGPIERALAQAKLPARPLEDVLRVLPGAPAQVLLERAQELDADLIVLGRHERRGLFDFGSTSRTVLAKVPKAVWVQPGPFREVRRILVPVDLSKESLLALERACALARELGARVETLHCFPPPEFGLAEGLTYPIPEPVEVLDEARKATREQYDRAMAEIDWRGLEHVHDFRDGDPITAILEKQSGTDLIAMGTHGRTGFSAAVLGNVAYSVLKSAEVPVLAIRHPDRARLAP